jgi:hypothetical protein
MLEKQRGELRSFVNAGLTSWQKEDIEEGKANLLWGKLAWEDWRTIEPKLSETEKADMKALFASLTTLPQQVPNVADGMLDMEGVRCLAKGKVLVFYRYNSAFDLVDIVRLAYNRNEWQALVEREVRKS